MSDTLDLARLESIRAFLSAIMERSPEGQPVTVQYHPDGSWSVYDELPAAQASRISELESALRDTKGYLEESANVIERKGLPNLADILRRQSMRARHVLGEKA